VICRLDGKECKDQRCTPFRCIKLGMAETTSEEDAERIVLLEHLRRSK